MENVISSNGRTGDALCELVATSYDLYIRTNGDPIWRENHTEAEWHEILQDTGLVEA